MSKEGAQATLRLRQAALLVAAGLAAFLAAAKFSPGSETQTDVVAPVVRTGAPAQSGVISSAASPSAKESGDSVLERLASNAEHNPFAPLNLQPLAMATLGTPPEAAPKPAPAARAKTPEPVVAAAPAAPTAPPLPFKAVGSIQGAEVTGGKPVAFLQQQDQVLVVSAGDSIGGVYRVEAITSEKIDFTYLPLGQRQVLALLP